VLTTSYHRACHLIDPAPDHILSLARSVEDATYTTHSPETSEAYKTRIRSLYQNLRSKTDATLRSRVLSGDILPAALVAMSHEDMKSEQLKAEEAKMIKENMDKAMVAQEEKSISTSLRCGKCGQRKVTYTQAQTRSADEPMTTFCTCLNCGNRWKFS
jgi:transcription elongation factor S-II